MSYERTCAVIADLHVPYQDDKALNAALKYIRKANPEYLVILGDMLDMKEVSFWKDKPSGMTFAEEMELGKEKLTEIKDMFPDVKIIYVKGNHENRLDRYIISKSEKLFGLKGLNLPSILELKKLGIQYVDNLDLMRRGKHPLSMGGVTLIHSEEAGRVGFGGVNLARTYLLKTLCPVMVAHHHQTQTYKLRTLDGGEMRSWLVGGLCSLTPSYQPHVNHNHGFAMIYWNSKQRPYQPYVRNIEIKKGKVLV